jgi:hypothetical protein
MNASEFDYELLRCKLQDTEASARRLANALRDIFNVAGELEDVNNIFNSVYSDVVDHEGEIDEKF